MGSLGGANEKKVVIDLYLQTPITPAASLV
jgi:hypothetical protein